MNEQPTSVSENLFLSPLFRFCSSFFMNSWTSCHDNNSPDETPWEGGTFRLLMEFTEDYPNKPPAVRFLSKVFHPNVYNDGNTPRNSPSIHNLTTHSILNTTCLPLFFLFLLLSIGKICLDILQNQWSPIYDIAAILTSSKKTHLSWSTLFDSPDVFLVSSSAFHILLLDIYYDCILMIFFLVVQFNLCWVIRTLHPLPTRKLVSCTNEIDGSTTSACALWWRPVGWTTRTPWKWTRKNTAVTCPMNHHGMLRQRQQIQQWR